MNFSPIGINPYNKTSFTGHLLTTREGCSGGPKVLGGLIKGKEQDIQAVNDILAITVGNKLNDDFLIETTPAKMKVRLEKKDGTMDIEIISEPLKDKPTGIAIITPDQDGKDESSSKNHHIITHRDKAWSFVETSIKELRDRAFNSSEAKKD